MRSAYIAFIFSLILFFIGIPNANIASAQERGVDMDTTFSQIREGVGLTAVEKRNSFDWRWLLPLLAVPVLFLFLGEEKDDDEVRYYDQPLSGVKGGRSHSKSDSEVNVIKDDV